MILALALAAASPATTAVQPAPLRCGAVERPGIAMMGDDGIWRGRAVEFCREAAVRAYGPGGRISFRRYDDPASLADAQADEIAFLSPAEAHAASLDGALDTGRAVATTRQIVVVPADSPMRRLADLSGRMVCFIVGTAAEDALDDWQKAVHVPIERLGFQEPDELRDAYAIGKCAALAVDEAEANAPAHDPSAGRALAPPLAAEPIYALVPQAQMAIWGSIVEELTRGGRAGVP